MSEALLELEDEEVSLIRYPEVHVALAAILYAERPGQIARIEAQWELATAFDTRYIDVNWVAREKHWPVVCNMQWVSARQVCYCLHFSSLLPVLQNTSLHGSNSTDYIKIKLSLSDRARLSPSIRVNKSQNTKAQRPIIMLRARNIAWINKIMTVRRTIAHTGTGERQINFETINMHP